VSDTRTHLQAITICTTLRVRGESCALSKPAHTAKKATIPAKNVVLRFISSQWGLETSAAQQRRGQDGERRVSIAHFNQCAKFNA
jgi:hypothetical protein